MKQITKKKNIKEKSLTSNYYGFVQSIQIKVEYVGNF